MSELTRDAMWYTAARAPLRECHVIKKDNTPTRPTPGRGQHQQIEATQSPYYQLHGTTKCNHFGALHEYMGHERLKVYVCVLYDSPHVPH